MNTVLVVIGVLLLVGGVACAAIAYPTMKDYETTMGQLARALSEEAEEEYQTAVAMFWLGSCCGVIGLVLLILGAALDKNKTTPTYQYPPPQPYQQPPPQQYYPPQQPPYQRPPQY